MTPEQLKASLLQYAIQGKLVEQRPEDGTAEELLSEIRKEKHLLISEGRIPKEKKLPIISDEEKEFDIPDNWRYVRVQDIASYITDYVANGSFATLKKHTKTFKTPNYAIFVRTMDLTADFVGECSYIDKESYDFLEKSKLYGGELILPNIGGSIGKAFLMPDLGMPMSLAPNSIMLKFLHPVMNKFFAYIIQSSYGKRFLIDTKGGTATPKFSKTELRNMVVMLPPIKEIERIVAKIEELLPYVDRYAEAYEKLEQFNTKFPEDMKKSILQYAIQGKLVEQRPEEGTAEELYQQIQDERKNYKIKELLVDALDDVPFDIPETWKWVHLQDIVKKTIKRGKSPKYTEKSEVQVFAQKCNVKTGGINMGLALFLDKSTIEKYPTEEYMCDGDIVINSTGGGTMGRVGVFHDTDRINNLAIVPDSHVTVIRACDSINYKFLYYFIKYNQKYLETQGEGSTNQTELKPLTIASLMLPLPPLEEQYRIVAKIEELLPFCDRLLVKE